jgi:hypothetical protein
MHGNQTWWDWHQKGYKPFYWANNVKNVWTVFLVGIEREWKLIGKTLHEYQVELFKFEWIVLEIFASNYTYDFSNQFQYWSCETKVIIWRFYSFRGIGLQLIFTEIKVMQSFNVIIRNLHDSFAVYLRSLNMGKLEIRKFKTCRFNKTKFSTECLITLITWVDSNENQILSPYFFNNH